MIMGDMIGRIAILRTEPDFDVAELWLTFYRYD